MKRKILSLCTALLIAVTGCGAKGTTTSSTVASEVDKLIIYTSFYVMEDFAQAIGGDHVDVHNIMPPSADTHDWEPTPKQIAELNGADMFIYNGVGFETWVEPVLASLDNKNLAAVETAHDLKTLANEDIHEEEEHQDEEDDHGQFDPHVWLSPVNAKLQAKSILEALTTLDEKNKVAYSKNYETLAAQLDLLDSDYRKALEKLPNKTIVVAHKAFAYMCHEYGLTQLSPSAVSSQGEPEPAEMAQIIRTAKEQGIKTVFYQSEDNTKVAQAMAKEIGAEIALLSPLENLTPHQIANGDNYISAMRQNLSALSK